jgi:hypothetical protein
MSLSVVDDAVKSELVLLLLLLLFFVSLFSWLVTLFVTTTGDRAEESVLFFSMQSPDFSRDRDRNILTNVDVNDFDVLVQLLVLFVVKLLVVVLLELVSLDTVLLEPLLLEAVPLEVLLFEVVLLAELLLDVVLLDLLPVLVPLVIVLLVVVLLVLVLLVVVLLMVALLVVVLLAPVLLVLVLLDWIAPIVGIVTKIWIPVGADDGVLLVCIPEGSFVGSTELPLIRSVVRLDSLMNTTLSSHRKGHATVELSLVSMEN